MKVTSLANWYSRHWTTCPKDSPARQNVQNRGGTNHAVMMGADVIKEPFAVISCDDFYGRDSFRTMGKFLAALPEGSKNVYSMVGFRVGNTLSEKRYGITRYL